MDFLKGEKDFKQVEIEIKDNGIGFQTSESEKIFDIFTRLNSREKFGGTGLGLALCKKIVHRHNGEIYARSVEGDGASFFVVLPGTGDGKRETGEGRRQMGDGGREINNLL